MKKEERVASYTHMSPKILLVALNYHYESGENLDFYQKFDLECLLEALEISEIDCSEIISGGRINSQIKGPFRLDNHPDYGFGIHISWELKQGISKFRSGKHWRIIGDVKECKGPSSD